uniref:Polymerase (DNA-directed), delta 4, accessory subunit n=2 Tax=Nothobranchius korthausae TaxID=1143690 RepID=A0A1A8G016_9TELE
MTTKYGSITNSFKVVKKTRRGGKQNKSPTPPTAPSPPPETVDNVFKTIREEDLQKLRQFDLDWRFGPCTDVKSLALLAFLNLAWVTYMTTGVVFIHDSEGFTDEPVWLSNTDANTTNSAIHK